MKVRGSLARELSLSAVQHIRHSRGTGRAFPAWIDWDSRKCVVARESWCYGSIGIIVGLSRAASLLGIEDVLSDIAYEATILAMTPATTQDAGLCHGVAGILHMCETLGGLSDPGREALRCCVRKRADALRQSALNDSSVLNGYAGAAVVLATRGRSATGWARMLLTEGL